MQRIIRNDGSLFIRQPFNDSRVFKKISHYCQSVDEGTRIFLTSLEVIHQEEQVFLCRFCSFFLAHVNNGRRVSYND